MTGQLVLCQIAGITRDAYYKWLQSCNYKVEQSELLEAILELRKHKWTLGYLAMTTQLAENKLSFRRD